jgi:CheY-like chemotaxis protein
MCIQYYVHALVMVLAPSALANHRHPLGSVRAAAQSEKRMSSTNHSPLSGDPREHTAPLPRILVVDDERDVCLLVRRILERSGYQVTVATSTFQALTVIAQASFDLLITDLDLPDASGWEVVRQMRANDGQVGVILLSGWSDQFVRDAGGQSAVDRSLAKPFSLNDFQRDVAETLTDVRRRRECGAQPAPMMQRAV